MINQHSSVLYIGNGRQKLIIYFFQLQVAYMLLCYMLLKFTLIDICGIYELTISRFKM